MKFNIRFLNVACLYYCMLTGLISIYYSITRNKMLHSRWLKTYTWLHNVATMCLLPCFVMYGSRHWAIYDTNPLLKYTNAANVLLQSTVVTLTILTRWPRERQLIRTAGDFTILEVRYFWKVESTIDMGGNQKTLDRMLYVKVALMLLHIGTMAAPVIRQFKLKNDWLTVCGLVFTINMMNIVNGALFHYFVALWHVCGRFELLNVRVKQIMQEVGHVRRRELLIEELSGLSVAHPQLAAVVNRLTHTYQYQILCMMAMYFVNNVSTPYFALVLGADESMGSYISNIIISCAIYLVFSCDMLLFNSMCERTARAAGETLQQLKLSAEIPSRCDSEKEFEKSSETFALQLTREQFHINILGMFRINKEQTLSAISQIILYSIVLIQTDYINLYRIYKNI